MSRPDGATLTTEILAAIAPLVDELPTGLVLEALAAAMMSAVALSCHPDDQGRVLRRYADRINAIADKLA